jgi:hypothetical protein
VVGYYDPELVHLVRRTSGYVQFRALAHEALQVFNGRVQLRWQGWTAAVVLAAVASVTVVVLIMSRGASAGARQTNRYTDFLGGPSSGSSQCAAPPAERHGGWICYVSPAP